MSYTSATNAAEPTPPNLTNVVRTFYDAVAAGEGPYNDTVDKFSPAGPVDHILASAASMSAKRILDLGCGMGTTLLRFVQEHESGTKFFGVDLSANMIARARARAAELPAALQRKIKFFTVDVQATPFMDGDFDFLYSECVLNLIPNRLKTLAEVARLLAPGGRFVYTDFVSYITVPEAIRQNEGLICGCRSGSLPLQENIALLERFGFTDITAIDYSDDKNRRDAELLASNPGIRRDEEELQARHPDIAAFLDQQVGYYLISGIKS